jgi:hypothetical protein
LSPVRVPVVFAFGEIALATLTLSFVPAGMVTSTIMAGTSGKAYLLAANDLLLHVPLLHRSISSQVIEL